MHKGLERRRLWAPLISLLAVVLAALALYFLVFQPAEAREFYFIDTTVLHFNKGFLYHTALSWEDDGEVQLLPIGFAHPWIPGNNTGLEPRAGHASVYTNGHVYVIGGDEPFADTHNDVFFTTIVDTITHELSDWITTTALPTTLDFYPEGLYFHEAAVVNNYLYIFGGKEDEGASSTYYDRVVYAPLNPDGTLGDWQLTTPLPSPRFELESVVLDGRIYIIGGADDLGDSQRDIFYATPDSVTGQILYWSTTSAPLPALGAGGYVNPSVALESGRIYVYGGASGVASGDYSPYVHYAMPITGTGDITGWTLATADLPFNSYASEGAAYQSGLLLAIAGAWNNAYQPSGDVRASLVDHGTGEPGEWVSTVALSPARFYHAVVQDEFGWLYSIGGATKNAPDAHRLNNVDLASPYGGVKLSQALGIEHTVEASRTIYAPDGTFLSPGRDVRTVPDQDASLRSLSWNTTITDPATMTITMQYRYHTSSLGWTDWFGPYSSTPGVAVTTTLAITGSCDLFQYRAYFASSVSTTTPLLNAVSIGVLAPPDLVAVPGSLTVTGCDTCPGLIPPNQPVTIQFMVRNDSSGLRWGNNFFAMLFITTTADYVPSPPALPSEICADYDPPTHTCPLIWALQSPDFEEGDPPVLLTTTWTFTGTGSYYLVAYVDYNNTPGNPPPIYDVREMEEFNNRLELHIYVGNRQIFLPLVLKR